MKISVLMSLYEKESSNYLKECLNSLNIQKKFIDQLVIVFDGPITSELEMVVCDFKGTLPITIVKLEKNIGLGRALNEGIKYCSNEWIFRMDSDDICVPNRFELQIKFIEENPDVVLLGGQIQELDENMNVILGYREVPITVDDIRSFSLLRNPFNHMTVAYKKSVLESLGCYKHHLYMEDYNLWLRVIAAGYPVYNLPDILVKARTGYSMYYRRKGLEYIKSEWSLAGLKYNLGLQNVFSAYILFLIRSIPRLLPNKLVSFVYKLLRRN